jgi:hypothetical protein
MYITKRYINIEKNLIYYDYYIKKKSAYDTLNDLSQLLNSSERVENKTLHSTIFDISLSIIQNIETKLGWQLYAWKLLGFFFPTKLSRIYKKFNEISQNSNSKLRNIFERKFNYIAYNLPTKNTNNQTASLSNDVVHPSMVQEKNQNSAINEWKQAIINLPKNFDLSTHLKGLTIPLLLSLPFERIEDPKATILNVIEQIIQIEGLPEKDKLELDQYSQMINLSDEKKMYGILIHKIHPFLFSQLGFKKRSDEVKEKIKNIAAPLISIEYFRILDVKHGCCDFGGLFEKEIWFSLCSQKLFKYLKEGKYDLACRMMWFNAREFNNAFKYLELGNAMIYIATQLYCKNQNYKSKWIISQVLHFFPSDLVFKNEMAQKIYFHKLEKNENEIGQLSEMLDKYQSQLKQKKMNFYGFDYTYCKTHKIFKNLNPEIEKLIIETNDLKKLNDTIYAETIEKKQRILSQLNEIKQLKQQISSTKIKIHVLLDS